MSLINARSVMCPACGALPQKDCWQKTVQGTPRLVGWLHHERITAARIIMKEDEEHMPQENKIVAEVIDGRRNVYGNPEEVFPRHAQVWSAIIGTPVTPEQVALCLIGYKLIRAADTPDYSDNADDIEGYLDIFRKIVGDGMVHARSVSEYLEKKKERVMSFSEMFEQEELFDRNSFKED